MERFRESLREHSLEINKKKKNEKYFKKKKNVTNKRAAGII